VSHVTELARAEADETEREDEDEVAAADEEGTPEPDPEPEPEAQAPELPSFDPKALESEQKRHERALDKVFGGLDGFGTCEHCGGIGIIPHGLEPEPEPKHDPLSIACDVCDGLGVMLTGSRNPQYVTMPCTTCLGHGYRDRAAVEAQRQVDAQPPAAPYTPPPPAPVWDAARGVYVDHLGQPLGQAHAVAAPTYTA
jgi:hypothetical protein